MRVIDRGHDRGFEVSAIGADAVEATARLTETRLVEHERTRRLLILGICFLFSIAALIAVFAPDGRERLAYVVSAVMVVLALGAIGARNFLLRVPGVQLDTRPSMLGAGDSRGSAIGPDAAPPTQSRRGGAAASPLAIAHPPEPAPPSRASPGSGEGGSE